MYSSATRIVIGDPITYLNQFRRGAEGSFARAEAEAFLKGASVRADNRAMTAKPLIVAVLAFVVLAGCAKGSDVTVSTGIAESGSGPSDLLTAQRVVLTTTDLPGYEVDPGAEADAASAQAAADFQQCSGAGAAALGDEERTAQSPGFHRGASTSVSSLATVALDESQSRAAMTDLSRPDLNGCITSLLRSVFERDLKVEVTSANSQIVSDGSKAPSGGQIVTWRTTLEFTSGSQRQAAYSDLTFLQSGRILASLFDFQLESPYPGEERSRLVAAMVGRMDV